MSKDRESLWSPNLRRWAQDAHRHGRPTHWYEGGGTAYFTPPPVQGNFLLAQDLTPLLTQSGINILWG